MRTTARKLLAVGAVAALGFAGGACAAEEGSTSPGVEAPADDLGTTDDTGDLGTTDGTADDSMDGGAGELGTTEGTTP